jgi:hypothetical protein
MIANIELRKYLLRSKLNWGVYVLPFEKKLTDCLLLHGDWKGYERGFITAPKKTGKSLISFSGLQCSDCSSILDYSTYNG